MEISVSQSVSQGKIRECATNNFYYYSYHERKYHLDFSSLNTIDTYITIFNLQQTGNFNEFNPVKGQNSDLWPLFKSHPLVKIIWESELAINRRYNTFPRNKLVVWELLPEESVQQRHLSEDSSKQQNLLPEGSHEG